MRYLKQTTTGMVFAWTPWFEKRSDMVPYEPEPGEFHVEQKESKPESRPEPVKAKEPEVPEVSMLGESLLVRGMPAEGASKEVLAEVAESVYGLKLDRRRAREQLVEELRDAFEGLQS